MASTKLSAEDRKDLEKFTKYLVYKWIQIVVQSRLGEKIKTQSKPFSSGSDWFNLGIKDIPEVLNETKKALSSQTQSLVQGNSVCVEISLKTAEGDTMILETWYLAMNSPTETSGRVSYTVYNRMGILLKSVFSVARVTPAYRLSRKQGADNFVICYRLYLGEPRLDCLGSACKTLRVSTVPTPLGTITLDLSYRVQMMISPQKTCNDIAVDLRDDHFNNSPKRSAAKPCHVGYREYKAHIDDVINEDAHTEMCKTSFSTSPSDPTLNSGCSPSANRKISQKGSETKLSEQKSPQKRNENNPEWQEKFTRNQKVGAFALKGGNSVQPVETEDIPFQSLLQHEKINGLPGPTAKENMEDETDNKSTGSQTSSKSNTSSAPDDFVLVEIKTPFAATDANTDLGRFYRDCQGAPPLTMFDDQPSVHDALDDITDQLALFEANIPEFDDFVNSLQTVESMSS